jgi:C4-dicarboxylate transporter DctM subunit
LVKFSPLAGIIFLLLSLMIGGLPVAFTLGSCGILGLFFHYQGFSILPMVPVIAESTLNNFVLLAIPLFIMGGVILNKSGAGDRIFGLASDWLGSLPGGLAVATVVACAILSAIIGISTAVAAAIGLTAIPALLSRGYAKELAYGSVAGGALGVLIPPSAGLIFYGYLTNSSVGRLFGAAFVPAAIIVGFFCIYCVVYCLATGKYEKPSVTWKGRIVSLKKASLGLSAPLVTLGGIYSGFFTPTEAAGVLVVYSMIISLIYKGMNWREFLDVLKESAQLGAVLMMIMVGGMILTNLTVRLQVATMITEWIATAQIPYFITVIAIFFLYLILGMFLDGVSVTVLTVPILFPLMPHLGIDVIVFGVILMIFSETALLTPPVGLNLFMIQAITGDHLWPIFKGNIPFAALLLLGAILLFIAPELALWLPKIFGL